MRPTLEQAVRCVVDWARRQRVFAGVRGTGLYTPAQDNLYREISDHLRNYRPVCLGTDEHPGGHPEPGRGSSGEHLSKGLAGPPGYAVLACHETPEGVKSVDVHNPWGHTGRGYTFAPQGMQLPYCEAARLRLLQRAYNPMIAPDRKAEHAYETPAGTFWLELSDLTNRCQALYTCATTPPVIIEGRRRAGLPVPG